MNFLARRKTPDCTCSMFFLGGLCTYPSDLRGTWYDSVYGTVAFTDSSMNMETKAFVTGFTNTNFTCQLNNGDMYVSK